MTIEIESLRPPAGGSPRFEGYLYGASASSFVVMSPPGTGADKHRHPYDETFIVLSGRIEFIVDGVMEVIEGGHITVVPPNTWHEFKNRSSVPCLMVSIHPNDRIIQEDWSEAVHGVAKA